MDRQKELFNESMVDYVGQGMNYYEAAIETAKSIAWPGESEHATGLAMDIVSSEYAGLDEKQGETDDQKWLMEHCYEYGFILRYPQDKLEDTGIIYEPWHYRYVGRDMPRPSGSPANAWKSSSRPSTLSSTRPPDQRSGALWANPGPFPPSEGKGG